MLVARSWSENASLPHCFDVSIKTRRETTDTWAIATRRPHRSGSSFVRRQATRRRDAIGSRARRHNGRLLQISSFISARSNCLILHIRNNCKWTIRKAMFLLSDCAQLYAPVSTSNPPREMARTHQLNPGPWTRRIPNIYLPWNSVYCRHRLPKPTHHQVENRQ